MRTRVLAAIMALACGALACASLNPSNVMKSWVGSHQSDLILKWGPPTRSTSDGNGGTILIYEYGRSTGQVPGRAVANPDGSVSYTAPQNTGYVATRMFWVNPEGVVYNWRWQGF